MATRLKHRWSLGHNYLAGITAGDWWRLLRENRFSVDPAYWHRAAFVTLTSILNSHHRRREARLHSEAIARVEVKDPPLFILGHWRSGTTLLHNLLCLEGSSFAFANTYQVVNPHTFLSTEETHTRWFARLLPPTPPMDNMALGFALPQEDEFAPCLMSLRSLYLGISFPRREDDYARYLTFDGVDPRDLGEWKSALLWFVKKLTLRYGRALVLKSPPHTARIRILLDLFPGARFVHIHRDPHRVFQSCRHYFDTAVWYAYLQRPDRDGVDGRILRRYNVLHDAFFRDRGLIPPGRFHEVRFEDLERDPTSEVRKIHERLDLPGFESLRPALESEAARLRGYRKNDFEPLEPAMRERVALEWARSFDAWGYPR